MPLLRLEAGEKLGNLVEEMTQATLKGLGRDNPSKAMLRDVFTRVFRLLAGKILKDKEVDDFGRIDLQDPATVLNAVARHYNAEKTDGRLSRRWKAALSRACQLISEYGSVRVVSPESLAHVYEHTLVNKELRKKLGIHATPPYLVDYIVWQLYDWICDIPREDRHVFEPACGHAPFLLSAMRMLRLEMEGEADHKIHTYLKTHVHGMDMDDFALEIARLSLTLADIPKPNGWDLKRGDMYASNMLAEEMSRCRVIVANPPYEKFTQKERAAYAGAGTILSANTKACEMLYRTIPYMASGACFGVVVPQGLLHSKEAVELRRTILSQFELSEIDICGDKLFEKSDHETAVLIGRRKEGEEPYGNLWFRRVRNSGIQAFRERFVFSSEERVDVSRLVTSESADLRVPELDTVWAHLSKYPRLTEVATLGQGLAFHGRNLARRAWTIHDPPHKDDQLGFANISPDLNIFDTPPEVGMNLSRPVLLHVRAGMPPGTPQVLLNYACVSREAWRLKAILDEKGHAITSRFVAVRPTKPEVTALYLWAVLNSPVANAYAACHLGKRDVLVGTMRKMPVPRWSSVHTAHIEQAAMWYCRLATSPGQLFDATATPERIRQALLEMDAAVLGAYDLPPRLERQLLDFFRGAERKGVGCRFHDYFPADFTPTIPLWIYISDDFRRCRADYLISRIPQVTDPALVDALAEVE
ncbi:MAG: N-6 DNA methylase [Sedimentisphaerales bacterium]|nr:N-6 DNA methylase [Sedimentisphaerales bacterium]